MKNLLQLRDEEIDHVLDVWSFSREKDQLLVQQIKLQHVGRRDGDEEDVGVSESRDK